MQSATATSFARTTKLCDGLTKPMKRKTATKLPGAAPERAKARSQQRVVVPRGLQDCFPVPVTAAAVARYKLLQRQIEEYDPELFEDGVACDLHASGIHTMAEAYRAGMDDMKSEIIEMMKRHNGPS